MKLPPNAITTNNLDVGTDFCGVYLLVNLKVLLLDRLWKVGKRGPRSVDERHSVRMELPPNAITTNNLDVGTH